MSAVPFGKASEKVENFSDALEFRISSYNIKSIGIIGEKIEPVFYSTYTTNADIISSLESIINLMKEYNVSVTDSNSWKMPKLHGVDVRAKVLKDLENLIEYNDPTPSEEVQLTSLISDISNTRPQKAPSFLSNRR